MVSQESRHCKSDSVSNEGTIAQSWKGFSADRISAGFFIRSNSPSRAPSWYSGKLGDRRVQSSKMRPTFFSWRESKSTGGQGISSSLKNDSEFLYIQSSLCCQLCPYIIKRVQTRTSKSEHLWFGIAFKSQEKKGRKKKGMPGKTTVRLDNYLL